MDLDPGLIVIILFVLAPLLDRLFRAGKQQQKPPEQGPPQRRPAPPSRARPQPQPHRAPQPEAEDASAADMLPDDLWEILTGQRRERPPIEAPRQERPTPTAAESRRELPGARPAPRRPSPAAVPRRVDQPSTSMRQRRLPGVDMRTELPPDEEAVPWRRTPPPEHFPVEGYAREIPVRQAPEVVSLEELVIDDEERHARFHERVAAFTGPAIVQRAGAHQLARLLRKRNELRRAFVMSEVLGPPKGLE